MESNSDKELREKLKGFEAPFDPEAWEQMDAMLGEKKKRRGFFWWWFGGIAAGLLLFGVLGYQFGKQVGQGVLATNKTTTAEVTGNAESIAKNNSNESAMGAGQTISTNQAGNEVNGTTSIPGGGNYDTFKNNTTTAHHSIATASASNNSKQKGTNAKRKAAGTKQKVSNRDKANGIQLAGGGEQETRQPVSGTTSTAAQATAQSGNENNGIAMGSSEQQLAEVDGMNLMWADELKRKEEELNAEKKEETKLQKKKKMFRYSVGVMGGMYATTPGWKHYNNDIGLLVKTVPMEKASKASFYAKPSWMAGFTHDFTFVDRFAFTNGLLYSQTTFKVYAPYAQAFDFAPDDYTCKISELAIPTGIKIYPVAAQKFRLYVSAGFIHHVKLQESFSYSYTPPPVSNIGSNFTDSNYSFFPTATDFTGNGYEVVKANSLTNELTTTTVNTTDFSINNARRYYTSFYAGVGVEGVIRKHWILFAEPTYSMTLQRIGYQERRKYNFGGNMGFRYQF